MNNSLSEIITEDKVEPEREWIIIHHSIMIDEVLAFVYSKNQEKQISKYFFNEYDRIIYQWLIDYYASYKKAPKLNIQNIFDARKSELDEDRSYIIEKRLDSFAEDYKNNYTFENELNYDFIKQNIIPKFVFEKKLDVLRSEIDVGTKRSIDHEKILESVEKFKDFDFEDDENDDYGVVIPGSQERIDNYFNKDFDKGLFSMPGVIGRYLGPFYRGGVYAITGTEKSGKTIFMQEICYQAVIFNGLKVFLINLEMPSEDLEERIWCRAGGFTNVRSSAGYKLYPIIDCLNNQLGTCKVLKQLPNIKRLLRSLTNEVSYNERLDWQVCTKCRIRKYEINAKREPSEKRFIPAIWYKEKKIPFITKSKTEKAIRKLNHFGFRNYRIRTFPASSVNFEDVYHIYNKYCTKKNFKPDVVVLDYPDILQPINGKLLDRQNIDFNWTKCRQFAQEENIALMIADQTNREARNSRSIKAADTSEDKRKDSHINMRITINRTTQEEELGLQRVGMLFRRKGKKSSSEVMLFQMMETCNPLLDSCIWPHVSWLKYPTVKESAL